jgi:hypothetical protein
MKAYLAIVGLYVLGGLLVFTAFYNWHCWMAWGQYVHLFWVILSSVLAAIAIFQASVFVLQIVDKWYFMHKAKRSMRE